MRKYSNNKAIFIAGGSGLVGTNLAQELKNIKANFTASYFSKIKEKSLKKFYKKYNFLNFKDCLNATKNKYAVIILAVQGSGIKSLKNNFLENFEKNLLIRSNLLKSCYKNKVKKIIWVSSSTVYQPLSKPIKEDQINLNLNPYDVYFGTGWQYRYLEKLFEYYEKYMNMNINIIRTSSIYGLYDNFNEKKSHVVPALIKKLLTNKSKLEVWGDKKVTRDFVFANDLAKAIIVILNSSRKLKRIINFSSEKATSIESLSKTLIKVSKRKKKIQFIKTMPSSAKYRVLDNSYFNNIFRSFKRTNLNDGLKKTVEWYKSEKYLK